MIGLHDADMTRFPNLAIMKLSAFHKERGDHVEWYKPGGHYDHVYASKVFTFTESEPLPDNALIGGTGSDSDYQLIDAAEHSCPDYSIYNCDTSYGFLTRGCPNKCKWCVVPGKEGDIHPHAHLTEFLRHNKVILMDNNVLACDHGVDQISLLGTLGVKVDFNQGLDARLIDDQIAHRLSKLKWLQPLRLACDTVSQMPYLQKAVQRLRYNNCTPTRFFVYVLVKDIPDALERVKFIKGLGLDPFAQPYRDFQNNTEPTKEQKRFARWVNHKAIFKKVTWEEYSA